MQRVPFGEVTEKSFPAAQGLNVGLQMIREYVTVLNHRLGINSKAVVMVVVLHMINGMY